jgi:hypothetical protein
VVGLNLHIDATVYPGGVRPGLAGCGGFGCFGATGTLTIGSTVLNSPAWDIPNLARLWAEGDARGTNVKLPTVPGARGYPTRLNEASHQLKFFITGDVDQTGAPYAEPWVGLEANSDLLWAGVFSPVLGRGTRHALLTMPDGTVRAAEVQAHLILDADVDDPSFVEATIDLMVVSGRFA